MSEPFVASEPDIPNNNIENTTPSVHQGGLGGVSVAGTIAKEIGTGEHAKDSFIWTTLKYCFYLGGLFSICLLLVFFHFSFDLDSSDKFDIVSALKDVWSIFTPILTLALGYAFGKRET